jgi:hypothetical protein
MKFSRCQCPACVAERERDAQKIRPARDSTGYVLLIVLIAWLAFGCWAHYMIGRMG